MQNDDTMKAVMLEAPGRIRPADLQTFECPPGGVRVAVKACGICSADTKMIRQGHPALTYPRIPGHEIAGVVDRSDCSRFPVGSRVAVYPGIFCGHCEDCLQGTPHRCSHIQILGFNRDGGFAQYLPLPMEGSLIGDLIPLPEEMSFGSATLAEPLACCINAQARLRVQNDETVLILGAGPLGLLHARLARHRGAKCICMVDPDLQRHYTALNLGIDTVLPNIVPLDELPPELSSVRDHRGFDVIIVATSDAPLTPLLLASAAPGGRIAMFSGMSSLAGAPSWDVNRIHYRELTLTGSYGCAPGHMREAVALLEKDLVSDGTLVTFRTSLENIQAGLDHTRNPNNSKRGLKAIVEVNE